MCETPDFVIFIVFYRILVSGENSGYILGCILGLRGVLYSVAGPRDPNIGARQSFSARGMIGLAMPA